MRNLCLLVGFCGLSFISFAQTKNHLVTPISKISNYQEQSKVTPKSTIGIYKTKKFLKGPRAKNAKPWNRTGKWMPIQKVGMKKNFLKGPAAKNYKFRPKNLKKSKDIMRYLLLKKGPLLEGKD